MRKLPAGRVAREVSRGRGGGEVVVGVGEWGVEGKGRRRALGSLFVRVRRGARAGAQRLWRQLSSAATAPLGLRCIGCTKPSLWEGLAEPGFNSGTFGL